MRAISAALAAAIASGCGAAVDTAYVLGSGRAHTRTEDSSPTEQSIERAEYEGAPRAGGAIDLDCYRRTRPVERRWTVHRSYRRQGSYDRVAYSGAIAADLIVGGLTAGVIAGMCTSDETDVSCKNLLYAAPFAVDIVYSLIRRATVKPKILIGKHEGPASLDFAASITAETRTGCEEVDSVWLGQTRGPSDRAILTGGGGGQTRRLGDGALRLELRAGAGAGADADAGADSEVGADPGADSRATCGASFGPDLAARGELGPRSRARCAGPSIHLSPEAAGMWLARPGAQIWVVGADGTPRDLAVDRCQVLRPLSGSLRGTELSELNRQCPPPRSAER